VSDFAARPLLPSTVPTVCVVRRHRPSSIVASHRCPSSSSTVINTVARHRCRRPSSTPSTALVSWVACRSSSSSIVVCHQSPLPSAVLRRLLSPTLLSVVCWCYRPSSSSLLSSTCCASSPWINWSGTDPVILETVSPSPRWLGRYHFSLFSFIASPLYSLTPP